MKTHVMIDLETMGNTSYAAPVAIGGVIFDPFAELLPKLDEMPTADKFYRTIDLASSMEVGDVDADTIYWWLKKPSNVQQALLKNLQPLEQAVIEFYQWIGPINDPDLRLWSHGATFDPVIWANMTLECERVPIPYKYVRDTRTLFEIAGPIPDEILNDRSTMKHMALHDAWRQARAVQFAYQVIHLRGDK